MQIIQFSRSLRKDLIVSLLAIYRPNFCAQCGCKIVRIRWLLWTSRKFCDACCPKFRKERFLQPMIACIVLFCFGAFIGRALKPAPPSLIIQRPAVKSQAENPDSASDPKSVAAQSITDEQVYSCGARTKKGTPCSRRVHGPVRCWQHKGMPAMLPQQKLRITE
jgi:hypothetical protein